ncbi:hypothetical protein [uncultured Shewanella sp.]|uniref:hypothetical protein n=1 Tax=uncultured Shewanella sp. TaxID=173975 RepID=UPI0026103ECC|nr:hypothetical protein [uncultured Shewanella sp.]
MYREGEFPLFGAPTFLNDKGEECIPQHYLQFQHSLKSVEKIVTDVEYDEKYPIFVCEDDFGLYIQVGIIGYDNYLQLGTQLNQKIVYGRKWRVEPNLPTSEIIQTLFLALQKAKEHEVRELFVLRQGEIKSTPFNCHHDLPLMADMSNMLLSKSIRDEKGNMTQLIVSWLALIQYNGFDIHLNHVERLSQGGWVLTLSCLESVCLNEESFIPAKMTLLLSVINQNTLYHSLMNELVNLAHLHVSEHFTYRGFTRFSRQLDIFAVANLSVSSRRLHEEGQYQSFKTEWSKLNYDTDETRVPVLSNGILGDKLKSLIESYSPLAGQIPKLSF